MHGDAADQAARVVVYTCIAGDYDRNLPPVCEQEGVRFVCFTDNRHVRARNWEILPLEKVRVGNDNAVINRFHKFFPHRIFPDVRWSIYVDANLNARADWHELVNALVEHNSAIGAFAHPHNRNLVEEVAACEMLGKFSAGEECLARNQLNYYAQCGISLTDLITVNSILVRDHGDPLLAPAMSIWWSQLFEWARRDQLSLGYALLLSGAKLTRLDKDAGITRGNLVRGGHRYSTKYVWRRRLERGADMLFRRLR